MNDAMYEHPATQGEPGHAARARGDRARARHRRARLARASRASGACPSRPSCWPRSRRRSRAVGDLDGLERARHRRRHARADRRGPLRRQPLVRAHGLRARRGGRRAAARGSRSSRPTCRCPRPPGIDVRRRAGPPPSSPPPARSASTRADVLLMAAAVADYRPAAAHAGKLKKDAHGRDAEPRADPYRGRARPRLAARRRPGQLLVGFAAEHGDGAVAYGREQAARARASTRSWSTTSARPASASSRPTTRSGSSPLDARSATLPRSSKARGRARDPGHGLEPTVHLPTARCAAEWSRWSPSRPERARRRRGRRGRRRWPAHRGQHPRAP